MSFSTRLTVFLQYIVNLFDTSTAIAVASGIGGYYALGEVGTKWDIAAAAALVVALTCAARVLKWCMTPYRQLHLPPLPTGAITPSEARRRLLDEASPDARAIASALFANASAPVSSRSEFEQERYEPMDQR